jgi:hypothetical protein
MHEPTPSGAVPPDLDGLFARLWAGYLPVSPYAPPIHALLEARGERVQNDHVAFRTFDDPRVDLDVLMRPFLARGYVPAGEYRFVEKRLDARHYEHPDERRPLVFASQLRLTGFGNEFRRIVDRLLAAVPDDVGESLPLLGRPWAPTRAEHAALAAESEYGGWLAAFGYRANHFTVRLNALRTFGRLEELNAFLKAQGIPLNAVGGEIKGSPAVMLEQSATVGGEVEVELADGPCRLPGCYYEFARRYPRPDGRLFTGFVEGSADRLFHSTDRR